MTKIVMFPFPVSTISAPDKRRSELPRREQAFRQLHNKDRSRRMQTRLLPDTRMHTITGDEWLGTFLLPLQASLDDGMTMARIRRAEAFGESLRWLAIIRRTALVVFCCYQEAEADRVHAFHSVIEPKTYELLKALTAPQVPSTKTFEELTAALREHLTPLLSIIGECAKFPRHSQH